MLIRRTQPWIKAADGTAKADPCFTQLPPDAPPQYRDLALRCLNKDPRLRPEFKEIHSDLLLQQGFAPQPDHQPPCKEGPMGSTELETDQQRAKGPGQSGQRSGMDIVFL